jgi:hypothetical protein
VRTRGTTPGDRGRFPRFDAVAQAGHWDDVTRAAVLSRLAPPAPLSYFDRDEEPVARALCDRLLAQDAEPRVPIVEVIDARLRSGDGDGYRYADMPEDGPAWKRSVRALARDAMAIRGAPFHELEADAQRHLIEQVRVEDGDWHGLPARRVFSLWMRYVTTAFYAHPWAWNEIGFPGPAYPRGYKTLSLGALEPFETREEDPRDPIPWVEKAEQARKAHAFDPEQPEPR